MVGLSDGVEAGVESGMRLARLERADVAGQNPVEGLIKSRDRALHLSTFQLNLSRFITVFCHRNHPPNSSHRKMLRLRFRKVDECWTPPREVRDGAAGIEVEHLAAGVHPRVRAPARLDGQELAVLPREPRQRLLHLALHRLLLPGLVLESLEPFAVVRNLELFVCACSRMRGEGIRAEVRSKPGGTSYGWGTMRVTGHTMYVWFLP